MKVDEERLKIWEMIGKMSSEDRLNREQQDRVPISPEEDYVLKEIQRVEGLPTRAKTWRWFLGKYPEFCRSQVLVEALKQEKAARDILNGV